MNSWRLWRVVSLLLLGMSLSLWASHGWDTDGLRSVIRATARTSLVLFSLAFSAGALFRLLPSEATRWLRRNRRYVGVSFATSHVIHLIALIALASVDQELFWQLTNVANIVFAGAAYLVIAAMTATSFDRAAAWLGPRKWRLLHLVGSWYIWLVFAGAVGRRVPLGPIYWAMLALVVLAAVLRIVAMQSRGRRVAVAPS